jgi:hypothetical protein
MLKYLMMLILIFPAISSAGGDVQYFPKGKLSSNNFVDGFLSGNFSIYLANMKEPSLWEMSKNMQRGESYRFLLVPPFANHVCIRIEINNSGQITVYSKVFERNTNDRKGEYTGKLIINRNKSISKKELEPLLKQIEDIKLWKLKSGDFPLSNGESLIQDASSWIFECFKGDKYQAVDIPMPNFGSIDTNKIIQLGKTFFALGDLEWKEDQ